MGHLDAVVARSRRAGRPPAWAVAGGAYLGIAALVWWHLWSGGVGGSLASGSFDPAQDVWWLAWLPHALGAGLDPFFTRSMYFPAGVNVLANTSSLLVGLVLSPVTVLSGPLVAFSVAVVLTPAADALVAFVVLRRYVTWAPAAFVGGLLYGFGPYVGTDLRYGHLNLTVLVVPPLVLLVMDRILVRRTGSPWSAGLCLGGLLVAEFFVSVEMLALGVVVLGSATVVVLAARGRQWRNGLGFTLRALGTAGAMALALLAFPTWWYARGPRHFSGAVWGDMSGLSASLESFVWRHGELPGVTFVSGGNGDFLGVPLLVVLLGGLVLWWRDRRLRFALGMAGLCAVLALGSNLHVGAAKSSVPMPAWPLLHLPLLSSAGASRFGAYLDLFCAMALALVVDHVRRALTTTAADRRGGRPAVGALAGAVGAVGFLSVAFVPLWPYPAHRMVEPAVLGALHQLPAGTLVREYPLVWGTDADALAWQAVGGIDYSVTGGYAIIPGQGGRATIYTPPDAMGRVFVRAYQGRLRAGQFGALARQVRRHAFDDGVGAVVVVTPSPDGAALRSLLGAGLGPPAWHDRSGALWLSPATAAAAGAISASSASRGCAARCGDG